MKRTLLFAVITVATFLVFSDLGLRFVLRPPPAKPLEWPPPDMTKHGMMADDALFWKLKPGYNGSWRLYKLAYTHELVKGKEIDWKARQRSTAPVYEGVTWQVNEAGFRGPLISAKKAPGIFLSVARSPLAGVFRPKRPLPRLCVGNWIRPLANLLLT